MPTCRKSVANLIPIATLLLSGLSIGTPQQASAQAQACTVTSGSLSAAVQQFKTSCPGRTRVDCDPLGSGWQCSTETLPLQSQPRNTTAANPSSPSSGNEVLVIQAENASQTTGSGWSTESSLNGFSGPGYIVWRGSDDFRTSDSEPPAGVKAYDFKVKKAGTYQFTARVQARVGNGSAASDKDNDAWVKFTSGSTTSGVRGNAAKWTKFFVGGADESWKNYSSGEQYDPTFFTSIQRDLNVGTHRVLVGGRSARFAIDNVGLKLVRATGGTSNPTTPVQPSSPVVPAQPATPPTTGNCSAQGSSLADAISSYANDCSATARKDCDPIGNGRWLCSSDIIGSNSPTGVSGPVQPAPAPAPAPTQPQTPVSGSCTAQGTSLSQARANYANSCPTTPRKDCDPVSGGRWMCSSENIGNNAPSVAGSRDTGATPTPAAPTPTTARISENDLLALHYDNCPDRDDGHAIVAGKAVIDRVGISNTIVVNGSCGADIRNRYQPDSVNVLRAVWGDNWLDGFNQEASAVNTSADRWAATLSSGNEVWVAEGGPSDFTAKVLSRLGSAYPSLDRKRIRIIQHSSGTNFNEKFTSEPAITLVKQVADYRAIPNGNLANNGSADLNEKSEDFLNIARQSRYSSEWNAAFNYLNPSQKLDFSDTVEILYIINDTQTLTVNDFANRYLR